MGNAVAVTEKSFDSEVLQAKVPVLVDFWAAWCGPCRMVGPIVDEIAGEYTDKLKVVKVDVDESQQISVRYGIQSIPTLMLFKNGSPVEKLVGAYPKQNLLAKIKPHLA